MPHPVLQRDSSSGASPGLALESYDGVDVGGAGVVLLVGRQHVLDVGHVELHHGHEPQRHLQPREEGIAVQVPVHDNKIIMSTSIVSMPVKEKMMMMMMIIIVVVVIIIIIVLDVRHVELHHGHEPQRHLKPREERVPVQVPA
jgi:hypothetical protein